MLYIYSANVKDGAFPEFREWAAEGAKYLASSAPKGWRFQGIFVTSYGFGSAQTEIHWAVENYAAFDAGSAAHRDGGDFAKAVERYYSFLDLGSGRGRVLRTVTEAHQGLASAAVGASALSL